MHFSNNFVNYDCKVSYEDFKELGFSKSEYKKAFKTKIKLKENSMS